MHLVTSSAYSVEKKEIARKLYSISKDELLQASSCHRQTQAASIFTIVGLISISEALRKKLAASREASRSEAHQDHERETLFEKNPVRNKLTHQLRQHFMRTNTESLGVVKFEVGDDGLENVFAFVSSHFHFVCVFECLFE